VVRREVAILALGGELLLLLVRFVQMGDALGSHASIDLIGGRVITALLYDT